MDTPTTWSRKSKVKPELVQERAAFLATLKEQGVSYNLYASELIYSDRTDDRRAAIVLSPSVFAVVYQKLLKLKLVANYFGYLNTRGLYDLIESYGCLAEFREVVIEVKDDMRQVQRQRKHVEAELALLEDVESYGDKETARFIRKISVQREIAREYLRYTAEELRAAIYDLWTLAHEILAIRLDYRAPALGSLKHYIKPWAKRGCARAVPHLSIAV